MKTLLLLILFGVLAEVTFCQTKWAYASGTAEDYYESRNLVRYEDFKKSLESLARSNALKNAFGTTTLIEEVSSVSLQNTNSEIRYSESSSSIVAGRWLRDKKVSWDSIPDKKIPGKLFLRCTIVGIAVPVEHSSGIIEVPNAFELKDELRYGGDEVQINVGLQFAETSPATIAKIICVKLFIYKELDNKQVYMGTAILESNRNRDQNYFSKTIETGYGNYFFTVLPVMKNQKEVELENNRKKVKITSKEFPKTFIMYPTIIE